MACRLPQLWPNVIRLKTFHEIDSPNWSYDRLHLKFRIQLSRGLATRHQTSNHFLITYENQHVKGTTKLINLKLFWLPKIYKRFDGERANLNSVTKLQINFNMVFNIAPITLASMKFGKQQP